MIRVVFVLLALTALMWPGASAVSVPREAPTVVSITFDGTDKSQAAAAEVLSDHGLAATFYINTGYLDFPGYLSLDQLRGIARNRQEIGGASLYGNDLTELSERRVRREVCDDRATLAQLGFQVTSFAYPHGAASPSAKAAVQHCGYNNARDFAGLYQSPSSCNSCPVAEPLPPRDDFRIRTSAIPNSLDSLQEQVTRAEHDGGGWVPLVLTRVCVCPQEKGSAISPDELAAFAEWLQRRSGTVQVRTVDQVMDGPLKAVTGNPLARLVPDPSAAISEPTALSRAAAWTVLGVGVGQAQLIALGTALSLAVVLTYRIATRDRRYGQ